MYTVDRVLQLQLGVASGLARWCCCHVVVPTSPLHVGRMCSGVCSLYVGATMRHHKQLKMIYMQEYAASGSSSSLLSSMPASALKPCTEHPQGSHVRIGLTEHSNRLLFDRTAKPGNAAEVLGIIVGHHTSLALISSCGMLLAQLPLTNQCYWSAGWWWSLSVGGEGLGGYTQGTPTQPARLL